MRYNEKQIKLFLQKATSDIEGELYFIDKIEGEKKRRAKLVNSILALYDTSFSSYPKEPAEVIVLSNMRVTEDDCSKSFHIIFPGKPFNTNFSFRCQSTSDRQRWISALKNLSYLKLQMEKQELEEQIAKKFLQLKPSIKKDEFSKGVRTHSVSHGGKHSQARAPAKTGALVPTRPAPKIPIQETQRKPVLSTASDLLDFSQHTTSHVSPAPHSALEDLIGIVSSTSTNHIESYNNSSSIRSVKATKADYSDHTNVQTSGNDFFSKNNCGNSYTPQNLNLLTSSQSNHPLVQGSKSCEKTLKPSETDLLIDFY